MNRYLAERSRDAEKMPEVVIHRLPLRLLFGQHPPPDTAHHNIQNGVHYQTHV